MPAQDEPGTSHGTPAVRKTADGKGFIFIAEEEKKSHCKTVIIVLLALTVLGMAGYIAMSRREGAPAQQQAAVTARSSSPEVALKPDVPVSRPPAAQEGLPAAPTNLQGWDALVEEVLRENPELSLTNDDATPRKKLDAAQIYEKCAKSVVFLLWGDGQFMTVGSGFVLDGYIITNAHCVEGAKSISIRKHDGTIHAQKEILVFDKKKDLAVLPLPISMRDTPSLSLSAQPVKIGEASFAIGAPEGLQSSISDGIVSQLRPQPERILIQTSTPISHGSSGGALLNGYGEVIGVTTGAKVDGQNLNFAVSWQDVKLILPDPQLRARPLTSLPAPRKHPPAQGRTNDAPMPDEVVDPVAVRFNDGIERFQRKDFDGAIASFTAVIKLDPKMHRAYCERAKVKACKGDLRGSLEDCEKGLRVQRNDPELSRVKGVILAAIKEGEAREKAQAAAERAERERLNTIRTVQGYWSRIDVGISAAKARSILGKPDSVRSFGTAGEIWIYDYNDDIAGDGMIGVDGKGRVNDFKAPKWRD